MIRTNAYIKFALQFLIMMELTTLFVDTRKSLLMI